jgi:hypothetical protein
MFSACAGVSVDRVHTLAKRSLVIALLLHYVSIAFVGYIQSALLVFYDFFWKQCST